MKENTRKPSEDSILDILVGTRMLVKPHRPVGRLKQLNKHARKMRRLHNPVSETGERSPR